MAYHFSIGVSVAEKNIAARPTSRHFEIIADAELDGVVYYAMAPLGGAETNEGIVEYVLLKLEQDENGEDIVEELSSADNAIGFILPSMTKNELFDLKGNNTIFVYDNSLCYCYNSNKDVGGKSIKDCEYIYKVTFAEDRVSKIHFGFQPL